VSKAKEIAVGIARRAEVAKAGFDRVRLRHATAGHGGPAWQRCSLRRGGRRARCWRGYRDHAVCVTRCRVCPWPLRFRPITSQQLLPSGLRRLYIARDADAAGDTVQAILNQRAKAAGVEAIALSPRLGDFNEDLHVFGLETLRAALRLQLVPKDVARFLHSSTVAAE